jgi:glycosyltransferase involved in cell wall biosynthesis
MCFAPCREVGGKRFSFLSRYLADRCDEYHVLARKNKEPVEDVEAFVGNVKRLRAFPYYSPQTSSWITRQFLKIWARWLCVADPYCGWVVPATIHGIKTCRKHKIDSIIVTVPYFSALIAAILISRITGTALIVDYRDPWTNHRTKFSGLFGGIVSRFIERNAVRQASAVVLCSDVMKDEFVTAFAADAPDRLEVIYNGFEEQPRKRFERTPKSDRINMVYAGNFYGRRQLSVIAHVLADMMRDGDISSTGFRLHLYSNLSVQDQKLIKELGLEGIVQVYGPVSYQEVQRLMRQADLLFLLSGDDVSYAVPFKFFDYLRANRPILAIAPKKSMVARLMAELDCGEHADFSSNADIRRALSKMITGRSTYSFEGASRFHWPHAAERYFQLIQGVTDMQRMQGDR